MNKDNSKLSNILWWGEVQSGKTRQIISYINSEILNQNTTHTRILALTSQNTLLHKQNEKRIIESLDGKAHFYNIKSLKNTTSALGALSKKDKDAKKNNYVFILSKGKTHLQKLNTFFDKMRKNLKETEKFRLIVIDDECDYFSNTNSDPKSSQGELTKAIDKVQSNFLKGSCISVTATPYYRSLKTKDFDELSILKPQEDGDSFYYGHFDFLKNKKIVREKLLNNDSDMNDSKQYEKSWQNAIREYKSLLLKGSKGTLLMRPSHLVHEKSSDDSKNVNELFDLVQSYLSDDKSINVYKITGDSEKNETIPNENSIIIGGNIISRGITFENLLVTWMVSPSTQRDNLEVNVGNILQRARWCGWRKDYFDDMKVYLGIDEYNSYVIASSKESCRRFQLIYGAEDVNSVRAQLKNVPDNALENTNASEPNYSNNQTGDYAITFENMIPRNKCNYLDGDERPIEGAIAIAISVGTKHMTFLVLDSWRFNKEIKKIRLTLKGNETITLPIALLEKSRGGRNKIGWKFTFNDVKNNKH